MSEKKIIRNRITQQEFFNLCMFLRDNQSELTGKAARTIQRIVQERISLKVDRRHLQRAQESLGVTWIVPRQERAPKPEASVRVLAAALADLYRRLGEEMPAELMELEVSE